MKHARNPETVHEPVGRYVHTIEASEESRMLFVSGQVGQDRDGNVPDDPAAQFEIALRNVLLRRRAPGVARGGTRESRCRSWRREGCRGAA